MKLSIVTTVFKSSRFIDEFYNRISKSIEALSLSDDCEIIFVNDGSPDDSLDKLKKIQGMDDRIKIIDLSRNFGHHNAIMAGLETSLGEKVFLIDIDLEEPPEVLIDLYQNINSDSDSDVIYGVRTNRGGTNIRKYGGSFFYKIFNTLSDIKIEENALTVRIMTKRFVSSLILHEEKDLFLSGLFSLTGYIQKSIQIDCESRKESTYNIFDRVNLFVQALVSFSSFPLIIFFHMGFMILILSLSYTIFLTIQVNINDKVLDGWTTIVVSIWLLSGMILMALGVIGIYVSRIFDEVKSRPRYIIKNKYGK